ncbi:hypothetical protein TRVL_02700 [Trypanosoma vivax]|nr:hypothetical protein TRVL_02700 [Trypanosoma vivax]
MYAGRGAPDHQPGKHQCAHQISHTGTQTKTPNFVPLDIAAGVTLCTGSCPNSFDVNAVNAPYTRHQSSAMGILSYSGPMSHEKASSFLIAPVSAAETHFSMTSILTQYGACIASGLPWRPHDGYDKWVTP